MKNLRNSKNQTALFILMISAFIFSSCTKEEVRIPSNHHSEYKEELAFDNNDDEPNKVWGKLNSSNDNSSIQAGVAFLFDNNEPIDTYVFSDGEFKFENLENKEYNLVIDINGYAPKSFGGIFPGNEKHIYTIY